jgi:hypothetical protein
MAKYLDGIQTVQNTKGNEVTPVLLDTIQYSSWAAANQAITKRYLGKFNRNAKKRVFYLINNLNQSLSSVIFYPLDSSLPNATNLNVTGDTYATTSIGTSTILTAADSTRTQLGTPADSFILNITMGATLATSGSVSVYVLETF